MDSPHLWPLAPRGVTVETQPSAPWRAKCSEAPGREKPSEPGAARGDFLEDMGLARSVPAPRRPAPPYVLVSHPGARGSAALPLAQAG